MRSRELVSAGRLASQRADARAILLLRDLLLVAAAGVIAGAVGPLVGRPVQRALGMPLVGSVAPTLPRVLILLVVLSHVNRAGALTAAAISGVFARSLMGGFPSWLLWLIVPVAAAMVTEVVWWGTSARFPVGRRLVVTGATLGGTWAATAWMLLVALQRPGMRMPPATICSAVVVVDALLGAAAGMLAGRLRRKRKGGE